MEMSDKLFELSQTSYLKEYTAGNYTEANSILSQVFGSEAIEA